MDVIELGTLGSTSISPSDSLSLDFSDLDNSLSSNEDDEDIISFSLDRSTNLSITADASGTENDTFGILFEIVTDDARSLLIGGGVSNGALIQDELEVFQADLAPGDYEIIVTPSLNSPPTTTNIEELSTNINYTLNITPTPLEDAPVDDTIATEPSVTEDDESDGEPLLGEGDTVYRFAQTEAGTQFYTTSEVERDVIIADLPNYEYEGESFISAPSPEENDLAGVTPVYRLFNTSTGVHLYTASEVERDFVTENLPNYTPEGISYYGYESQQEGTVPLYRFYNSSLDAHFYTPSMEERDEFLASPEYQPEGSESGIAFYVQSVEV